MKTSDLTGAALDWAVAKCEGYTITSDGISTLIKKADRLLILGTGSSPLNYSPSTNWAQGGRIIAQDIIDIFHMEREPPVFEAEIQTGPRKRAKGRGPTHLIAAMRCFVASKIGDEIELPEELT